MYYEILQVEKSLLLVLWSDINNVYFALYTHDLEMSFVVLWS